VKGTRAPHKKAAAARRSLGSRGRKLLEPVDELRVWSNSSLTSPWFAQEKPLTVFHPEHSQGIKVIRRFDSLRNRFSP